MLQLLRRIVQALDRAADLNSALDSVVCDVKKAMKVDGCSLFLADSDRGEYLLIAADGLPAGLTGRMRIKYGQGLIGSVGEREELINLEDAKLHPNFNESKLVATTGYRSFMGVPIIDQGDLLGVLCVQKKRKGAFDNDQEAFLVTLAVQLGGKIAQAVAKGALQAGKNRRKLQKDTILRGISGASGIAIGEAVVVFPPADLDSVPDRSISAKQIPIELENFKQALTAVRDDIIVLRKQANNQLSATEEVLFNAYLQILDSPTLFEEIVFEIKNKIWAPTALKRVVHRHLSQFDVMEDVYLQERASDFRDLGRRILSHLQSKQPVKPHYAKKTILVSEEVTATMMMEVPLGQLVGIVSGLGSSNSHVAILGRALGIPTVMGAENMPILQLDSQELIVDGYNGEVYVAPSRAVKREFMLLAKEEAQLDRELEALRELPAETPDHHRVNLYINTGLSGNLGLSLSVGAEGVGLYRTELPFMLSDRLPSEDEQCKMYTEL
ncbi:MAG TPA: phosphoenolpyruvate-utilizing N-terminal domain-containing protein, partial [Coxiellaceae bacterium]|nr:phosphoenolpyruvate-utilizing N-terminal domain-containing protein [Coxiellaceae bacterium]